MVFLEGSDSQMAYFSIEMVAHFSVNIYTGTV